MGAREERRRERQQALLDAAMEIASEQGLDALTIPELARRMGASVGGLYRYYESKEAILVALQERAIVDYSAALDRRLRGLEPSLATTSKATGALTRVLIAFGFYLDYANTAPLQHRLMEAFLASPEPLLSDAQARAIDAVLAPLLQRCADLLQAAVDAGALGDGDALERTHLMWAALHGLGHFRKRDRIQQRPLRVAALAPAMLRTLLQGFGANARALEAAAVLTLPASAATSPPSPG